jgi:hypothetical protein
MTREGGDQECLKNELSIAAQLGKNFTPFETKRESSKISKATSEHIVRISNEKGRAKNRLGRLSMAFISMRA